MDLMFKIFFYYSILFFKAYDIWSLGVTLFCFVFGKLPFEADSLPILYQKIRTENLQFPETPISSELKNLIIQMLTKDPEQRISLSNIKVRYFSFS